MHALTIKRPPKYDMCLFPRMPPSGSKVWEFQKALARTTETVYDASGHVANKQRCIGMTKGSDRCLDQPRLAGIIPATSSAAPDCNAQRAVGRPVKSGLNEAPQECLSPRACAWVHEAIKVTRR